MKSNDVLKKSRALVLSGGGAKGAYAFGCLKAFRDNNFEFEAVSGTSVGALNAYLWSTGAMQEGEELWNNLRFSTVYPLKNKWLNKFPVWFIRIYSVIFVIFRLVIASLNRLPVPYSLWWVLLFSLTITLPFSITALYLFLKWDQFFYLLLALFTFLGVFSGLRLEDGNIRENFLAFSLVSASALILLPLSHYINNSLPIISEIRFVYALTLLLVFFGIVFILMIIAILFHGYLNSKYVHSKTILDSTPLREKLQEISSKHTCKIPTFACVAERKEVYNPDDPRWEVSFVNHNGRVPEGADWLPLMTKVWCPDYLDLSSLKQKEVSNYCAASAALPFGIVPPIKLNDHIYIDGGIIDNCPILPILNQEGIDEIYIVILDYCKDDEDACKKSGITKDKLIHKNKLLKLSTYPKPQNLKSYSEVYDLKKNKPNISYSVANESSKLILIYPKKKIGGWFSGTLNFNGVYAQEIMKQGYLDAKEIISTNR